MGTIEEIGTAARAVAGRTGRSVVGVGRAGPRGSGVVVGDGLVLTNAHNVRGGSPVLTFPDGRTVDAEVKTADRDVDLAVLAVDTAGVDAVTWAEEEPEQGTPVFALANPGGRGLRVSFGLVSALGRSFRGPRGRRIRGALEHTAPLPRGSSGGPVVDAEGRVVGINTSRSGDGFYVALPADAELRARVAELSRGQSREAPRLGIGVAPPRVARRLRRAVGLPERDGVLVRLVEDGSPAVAAGIEPGDLIVGAGGADVVRIDDLETAIERASGRLELRVVRGIDERAVSVSLEGTGEAPERA